MWQAYIKQFLFIFILFCSSMSHAADTSVNTTAPTIENQATTNAVTPQTSNTNTLPAQAITDALNTTTPPAPIIFEEGKHYKKLAAKITSNKIIQDFIAEDPNKIQVVEFFSYACLWCQRLHPFLNEWSQRKPDNVAFHRFPVVFHPGWDKLAKAYYMVEQLDRSELLDKAFFEAIQQHNINLSDEKLLKEFFARHEVPEEKFNELYNSFAVSRAFAKGNDLSNAYQIALSPVIILNAPSGSYLISAPLVGSEKGVIDVINYLIEKESPTVKK